VFEPDWPRMKGESAEKCRALNAEVNRS